MRSLSVRDKIKLLREFCETNKRLPRYLGSDVYESKLFSIMCQYNFNKNVKDIKAKYRSNRTFEDNFNKLIEFCEHNKRLPAYTISENEGKLKSFVSRHRGNPAISGIVEKYRRKTHVVRPIESWITEITQFCETHNRLPRSGSEDLYEARLANFRYRHSYDERIKCINNKYRVRREYSDYNDGLKILTEFCTENNKLPSVHKKGLERRLHGFMAKHRDREEIQNIIDKYRSNRSFKCNLNLLTEWVVEHDRLPKYSIKDKNEFRLRAFLNRHTENKHVAKLIKKYGL